MTATCDYICDGCGAVEEDAGTLGPEGWAHDGGEDFCPDCQEPDEQGG